METLFHTLKIIGLEHPIPDATTLTFALPEHLREEFRFYPGQHIVLRHTIKGQEIRRTYSLHNTPLHQSSLQITAKRVAGGLMSNFIADQLKVGDTMDLMRPQGRFYANVEADDYKSYFMFAAGSGITPIFSMIQTILTVSPLSKVYLLYGNTNQDTILFKESLHLLAEQNGDRFQMVHTLSAPKVWSTWKPWKGRTGRLDAEAVRWFISEHPPIAQQTEYYICGPGTMNQTIRKTLMEWQIPKELIHVEQFGQLEQEKERDIAVVPDAQLRAQVHGKSYELIVPENKTILQVLKEAEAEPPYSCESGVCGTCVARLTEGKAQMKVCMALEEEDIKNNKILTCQALPVTRKLLVEF